MKDEKGVKGYQIGFLNSVGVSVEEVLHLPVDELWSLIFSFCELNDVMMIFDEEDRYVLGRFSDLPEEDQTRTVSDFHATVLEIREDLKSGGEQAF